MAKDRQVNPATAALKAAKKSAIKKNKASVQSQRAERFAKRNPFRIEAQINELKQAQSDGSIKPKDKQILEQLEKEHKAILKAREQLGDKAPVFHKPREQRDNPNDVVLGKRRRGSRDARSDSETDDDVKGIPMPKDVENMPPAPKRKPRPNPAEDKEVDLSLPKKPEIQSQAVYESAPVIKDLRMEAARAFVPSAVRRNIKQVKGDGRLLEPEELDKLEKAGYRDAEKAAEEAEKEVQYEMMAQEGEGAQDEGQIADRQLKRAEGDQADDLREGALHDAAMAAAEAEREAEYEMMRRELDGDFASNPQQEEQTAESSLRKVELEEVEDEDG
jgi:hypothetical protein